MFAHTKRFTTRNGQMVVGASQSSAGLGQHEVAVTQNRGAAERGKQILKETAMLSTGGFGMGLLPTGNSMSVMGSGPMSTTTMLSQLVPENEALLNVYYRDIYFYDPVAGSAVDMISSFPFSDFSLLGIDDEKVRAKYEESVYRLNVRTLMPQISTCYLVDGKFIGTLIFNRQEKSFYDVIIHSSDTCVVDDLPLFSSDPSITVQSNQMLTNFLNSEDPQAQVLRQMMSPKLVEALKSSRFKLDALSTLYLARRTIPNTEPTSFLKRILPIYLLEKLLYRGTLVEAARRQRAMLHITLGDDTWEPTPQEMLATVLQFQQADLDPLGAVVATRNGVNVAEVRQGGDFWKWSDNADILTPLKLRALGTSEAFLTGDANYSNAETAMSVFMENLDQYRSYQTHKVFDCKVFPMIAITNGFYQPNVKAPASDREKVSMLYRANNNNTLLMPTLRWHKQLKAREEDDQFQALDYMSQKGIPVPLRMIFAACKVDPNDLWQDLQQDKLIKERLAKVSGVKAEEIAPAGDAGGENVDSQEFAGFGSQRNRSRRHVPLLAREFGELGELTGETKTGKKKWVYNQREMNAKINENIVKAAATLSKDPAKRKLIINKVRSALGSVPNMGLIPGKGGRNG